MLPESISSLRLYLRLLGYVKPYWRVFAASIVAMAVVSATEPAFAALVKPLLDGTFGERDPVLMTWLPLLIVGLFLIRGLAAFASGYCINWVAQKLVVDLRNAMFGTLVRLPTGYYDATTSGSIVSRFTYSVTQVTAAATHAVNVIVRDSLAVMGLLGWLLYLNWRLTALVVVVGPPIALIIRYFSGRLRKMNRADQIAMGDLNHVLEESIGCHRVVKVFGGQSYETGRFSASANKIRRFQMKIAVAAAATVPMTQLVASIALAGVVYFVVAQAAGGQTTVGAFVSYIVGLSMLLGPLKRLTNVNEVMQRGLAAAEMVFGLIDEQPEPDRGTAELGRARGEVEYQRVTFVYPGATQPALHEVFLRVPAGETVALVGSSGSGKTTLVNLLPRFYAPTSGRVLIDGIDTAQIRLSSLRENVALVSQDIVLFNDTVAANIGYGRLGNHSEADIVAAAEAAHAMSFIREMPEGLATFIGEDGVRLSGGQRQRLAIARAFLKDAPILILDEATSALDSESERHIQEALEVLMRGRTTFVIAHRLSTIESADRIVVLDDGRIAEIGQHAELLARDGIYARLYRIQYSREEAVAA
jgi:ATP-binding cassette, subfamily B, bacterial MsbA